MSLRQEKTKLVVIFGLLTFGVVFLVTGTVLTAAFGLYPGDEGYNLNKDPVTGVPNTPWQDFMANACVSAPWYEGDKTVILDTKGLEEAGLLWYDHNYCFDLAKTIDGYTIDKIEPYGDDQMKITLVKKP